MEDGSTAARTNAAPIDREAAGGAPRDPAGGPDARRTEFLRDFRPLGRPAGPSSVTEALLKHPAALVHEVVGGGGPQVPSVLLAVALFCLAGYGLVMGAFSGGAQFWAVPVKLAGGMLLSALICLPSLYIFSSLGGGSQTLGQTGGLMAVFLALQGLLLLGFAPIAWIFSQSTSTVAFMGVLHLSFWVVAACFGLRLLNLAFDSLNRRAMGILRAWGALFIVVALQMSTTLRPLVGPAAGRFTAGKKLFLTHWGDCLAGRR